MKYSAEQKLNELYKSARDCEAVTTGAPHSVASAIRWALEPVVSREGFLLERYEMRCLIEHILRLLDVRWDIKEEAPIWYEVDQAARDV